VKQITPVGVNTVKTETIGTLTDDFARYTSINTRQRDRQNKPINFGQVLGVWGKSVPSSDQSLPAQFLYGNILTVVPFAPLNAQQRQRVLQTMRDLLVYDVDYSKAISRTENGRSLFVYTVKVNPASYVAMLKKLAQEIGLHQLDKIDPMTFAGKTAEEMEISVDKLSQQLTHISYQSGQREESYSGYGLQAEVNVPAVSVPIPELQRRLQSLQ
jgi:hypothetical protein